mgnify:CR=1 FL=1
MNETWWSVQPPRAGCRREIGLSTEDGCESKRSGSITRTLSPGSLARRSDVALTAAVPELSEADARRLAASLEAAGAAVIAGVQIRPLPGERGLIRPDTVSRAIRAEDPHIAPATLLSVEDTANRGGGTVHPLFLLDALSQVAKERGLATHMDGARAFNAVVASGQSLAERPRGYDTVSFCLSKGLGCAVGSMLCGPRDLIHVGRRVRKMLGGGMRQAGFLAAGGLYALEHHVERLTDDHARAKRLAEGLRRVGYTVDDPDTNLVFIGDLPDVPALSRAAAEHGVRFSAVGPTSARLALHLARCRLCEFRQARGREEAQACRPRPGPGRHARQARAQPGQARAQAAEKFKAAAEAYEILSDEAKRSAFSEQLINCGK